MLVTCVAQKILNKSIVVKNNHRNVSSTSLANMVFNQKIERELYWLRRSYNFILFIYN